MKMSLARTSVCFRIQPSGCDDPGSFLPMPGRLFEGVGELQQAQLTVVPPDNLNADRQA